MITLVTMPFREWHEQNIDWPEVYHHIYQLYYGEMSKSGVATLDRTLTYIFTSESPEDRASNSELAEAWINDLNGLYGQHGWEAWTALLPEDAHASIR